MCPPDDWYIEDTARTIISITNQISKGNEIKTFIIFIGVLATDPNEISRTTERLNEFQEPNVRFSYISLTKDQIQERLAGSDIQPALYETSRDIVEERTLVNMLLSSTIWHGNQVSKYFLLADSSILLKPGSLITFIEEFERKGGSRTLLRLKDEKVNNVCGVLYSKGRALESLAEYLYWLAPYSDTSNLIMYFEHLHQSRAKAVTSEEMFIPQQLREDIGLAVEKNPLAMITTNMTVAHEFFPTNPYERGELFWTSTSTKGSFLIIKFTKLHHIKAIRIETGINIYLTDILTRAVLEEATEFRGINCGDFKPIADFSSGRVKLSFPSSGQRRLKTSCLRIRLVENEGHWVGIRFIQIIT